MTENRRWWQRVLDRALAPQVERRVALALSELDGFYPAGTPMERRERTWRPISAAHHPLLVHARGPPVAS